jgi:hypothetical protein
LKSLRLRPIPRFRLAPTPHNRVLQLAVANRAQSPLGTEVAPWCLNSMKKPFSIAASLAAGSLLLAAGCGASYPPPNDQLAGAIAASRGAEEAGARRIPRAALHLKLAEEGIAQVRTMMKNGENQRADLMSQRAATDAELALALARENAALARSKEASAKAAIAEGARR